MKKYYSLMIICLLVSLSFSVVSTSNEKIIQTNNENIENLGTQSKIKLTYENDKFQNSLLKSILESKINHPEYLEDFSSPRGRLNIKIENIGNTTLKNISIGSSVIIFRMPIVFFNLLYELQYSYGRPQNRDFYYSIYDWYCEKTQNQRIKIYQHNITRLEPNETFTFHHNGLIGFGCFILDTHIRVDGEYQRIHNDCMDGIMFGLTKFMMVDHGGF